VSAGEFEVERWKVVREPDPTTGEIVERLAKSVLTASTLQEAERLYHQAMRFRWADDPSVVERGVETKGWRPTPISTLVGPLDAVQRLYAAGDVKAAAALERMLERGRQARTTT